MIKTFIILGLISLFILGSASFAAATIIDLTDFNTPTLIDFNDAPNALIGTYYSDLEFVNLSGGNYWDTGTGTGVSEVASNFFDVPGYPTGEIIWDSAVTRVGFFITTNNPDDTTITAYLGGVSVGSHVFDTFGAGMGGSFAGIEFLGGIDRLIISSAYNVNGAFSIDNLMYESAPVPEPTTLLLLGTGLIGLVGVSRKKFKV